jgi:hypothetical protein
MLLCTEAVFEDLIGVSTVERVAGGWPAPVVTTIGQPDTW